MSLESIVTVILLPCIAWLMLNSNRNGQRLTRIETQIENLLDQKQKKQNTEYEY